MMTIDAQNDSNKLQVVSHEKSLIRGQIGQLPDHMLAIINEWLIPLEEIPGLIVQAETTGQIDPVLAMLQRLAASEGYSPTDPRLRDILELQAQRFVTDMKALKEKAMCYMALLSMYLEQVERHDLYLFIPGCETLEDYCKIHINMSPDFLHQVQRIGEYCRVLRRAGWKITEIFDFPLDKITYAFTRGLQAKLDERQDRGIVEAAQLMYPDVYETAQYQMAHKPIQAPRGREAQQEQKVLAQAIMEKLPEADRRELSQKAKEDTQAYARAQLYNIINQPDPGALLKNHAEEKGETPKEKAKIVFKCTYDPATSKFVAHGETYIPHEMGLIMCRGQWDELFEVNQDSGLVKLSGVGEYIVGCTNPSVVPSTLTHLPSRPF